MKINFLPFQITRKALLLLSGVLSIIPTGFAQNITLDFSIHTFQLDALDGGSVCQFSGITWLPDAITRKEYDNLSGFPVDEGSTRYSEFMDVCFSGKIQKGMALHQLWATPCVKQTPENSVGKTYNSSSWPNLDFRMYNSDYILSSADNYTVLSDDNSLTARGYTIPVFEAAARRAREEGYRIMYRLDVHFSYPSWMFGSNPAGFLPSDKWEEAALHYVYFVKYLTSKYGIPIHIISLMNEPDYSSREYNHLTPQLSLKFATVVREKLNEAGLYGVRINAGHWLNDATVNNFISAYQSESNAIYRQNIDAVGNHAFGGQPPKTTVLDTEIWTPIWVNSGGYQNYWDDAAQNLGFCMGPENRIDETISLELWRIASGQTLQGTWSLRRRAGMTGGYYVPPDYDPYTTGYAKQIDGAATVNPYVRPGMFVVSGSTKNHPTSVNAPYNVVGFGGRGFNEVIVITNNYSSRTFNITCDNINASSVYVIQCDEFNNKTDLGDLPLNGNVLTITVPANSVTACISEHSVTKKRAYVIVKDINDLTEDDLFILNVMPDTLEVYTVSQNLPIAEQKELRSKRHPVDAMGSALYIISNSVDDSNIGYAYRTVMAPVITHNENCRLRLGIDEGASMEGGEFLSFRDVLDPPEEMLDSQLPRACGMRFSLNENSSGDDLLSAVKLALYKLSGNNPVSVHLPEKLKVKLYPNPADETFRLILPSGENCRVSIFDIYGKLAFQKQFQTKEITLSTGLKSGLYILVAEQSGLREQVKLVIK